MLFTTEYIFLIQIMDYYLTMYLIIIYSCLRVIAEINE